MKITFIIGLMFILSACSTGPKYQPQSGKSLVVGKLVYIGKGQVSGDEDINMNGIVKRGIEITVQEPNSKKVKIKTGEEGLFYYHALANTKLLFKKLFLKKTDVQGSTSSITTTSLGSIKTAKNGVTDIGTIYWEVLEDGADVSRKKGKVKALFKKINPKSVWLNQPWHVK